MPKTKELKKYVVASRAIVMLVIIGAIILIITNMNKSCLELGELPERFIHEHQVSDFDKEVFQQRREKILSSMDADVIIISAATPVDFRYLTGFPERSGIAVIRPGAEEAYTLFVTPWEIYRVMWIGKVYGMEGAIEKFGADAAYPYDQFDELLPELLEGKQRIYTHLYDPRINMAVNQYKTESGRRIDIRDIAPIFHEHRIFKDDWEVTQLQQAVDVTLKAHRYVMETLKPGVTEHEVQAGIEYVFRRNGLGTGFPSIVGSGPNACLLHHRPESRVVQDDDLVLVDIGAASVGGYSADVTRTYPAKGTFTPKQREIYELVLTAFDESIKLMKPGYSMLDCHHKSMEVMVKGLHQMGLLPDTTSWWQKRFYMQHRVNHYIGLQTQDVGSYGYDPSVRDQYILNTDLSGRNLEPGMVMTLEPGLYFMEGLLDGIHDLFGHLATKEELNAFVEEVRPIYEKYEGIGVRIEDDILITEDGHINLSGSLPRTVAEIEKAMR